MINRVIMGLFCALAMNEANATLDNLLLKYNCGESNFTFDNRHHIEKLIERMELKYSIPHGLLLAIALTESGRHNKEYLKSVPWPWTVNACGKSYYFKTKNEAIQKVLELRQSGVRCIDIGCMQINLLFHGNAFKSLHDAFTPECNIEYAAKLLRDIYVKTRSWETAVCYYHSKNERLHKRYYSKVSDRYRLVSARPKSADRVTYHLCKNNYIQTLKHSSIDEAINCKLHKLVLANNNLRFKNIIK